jgi:hypothetical protein
LRDQLPVRVRGEEVHRVRVYDLSAACGVDHRVPENVGDELAINAGCNEALSKPCLPTDLLESAMRLLPPI